LKTEVDALIDGALRSIRGAAPGRSDQT